MPSTVAHPEPEALGTAVAQTAIPISRGLHGREAAMLMKLEQAFDAELTLDCCGWQSNARSIMGLLCLDPGPCTELTAAAAGPEAEQMIRAIEDLFASGFRGTDQIPESSLFREKFAYHFNLP